MNRTVAAVAAAAVLFACSAATAAPASADSVERLLALTRADQVLEVVYGNLEQNIRQGMSAAIGSRTLTAEQQQLLQVLPSRLSQVMRDEMSWQALKPLIVDVYLQSFDQDEVDGLIAFYSSPIGQRFVQKQPAVAQRSVQATQQLMTTALPRIQAAMEAALREAGVR